MNTLFCLGTFQAIANLPPLLAVAEAGDQVIFLDSKAVDSQKIIRLLPKNLRTQTLKISDALPKIIEEVSNFLSTVPKEQSIYFIFNGGTKLSSLAVLEALRERAPSIIYGQEKPCEYWECESKLQEVKRFFYPTAGITLEMVLASNGVELFGSENKKIYSYQAIENIFSKNFSYKLADTIHFYDNYFDRFNNNAIREILSFDNLLKVNRKAIVSWQNVLIDLIQQPLKEKAIIEGVYQATLILLSLSEEEQRTYLEKALQDENLERVCQSNILIFLSKNYPSYQSKLISNYESLKGFYNKFLRALEITPVVPTGENLGIGRVFEEATAARTIDFLKNNPDFQKIISEIWLNVKICNQKNPETVTAEYDVLILLKNAILLHLECKSGSFKQKDIDARQYVMQGITSKLAKFYIVSPLFTNLQRKPYFASMLENFKALEKQRDTAYFFLTIPNQPNTFTYQDDEQQKTVPIPTFEDSLKKILQPYLSTSI